MYFNFQLTVLLMLIPAVDFKYDTSLRFLRVISLAMSIFIKVNQLEKRWNAHQLPDQYTELAWRRLESPSQWISFGGFLCDYFSKFWSQLEENVLHEQVSTNAEKQRENLTENDKKSQVKWWAKWARRWDPKILESEFALQFEALTGNVDKKKI